MGQQLPVDSHEPQVWDRIAGVSVVEQQILSFVGTEVGTSRANCFVRQLAMSTDRY
jgi:hypothetical protein